MWLLVVINLLTGQALVSEVDSQKECLKLLKNEVLISNKIQADGIFAGCIRSTKEVSF